MRITLAIAAIFILASWAYSKTISREEALKAAFPGARVDSSMVFLTEAEMKAAAKNSGVPVSTGLVARYVAIKNGAVVGRAYIDTHVVRTKKESLLIILDPSGKLRRVEIVAFLEPPEYIPPDRWYDQFEGRHLGDELKMGRTIRPVTGATLTARATTEAVRRVMAIDQLLEVRQAGQTR